MHYTSPVQYLPQKWHIMKLFYIVFHSFSWKATFWCVILYLERYSNLVTNYMPFSNYRFVAKRWFMPDRACGCSQLERTGHYAILLQLGNSSLRSASRKLYAPQQIIKRWVAFLLVWKYIWYKCKRLIIPLTLPLLNETVNVFLIYAFTTHSYSNYLNIRHLCTPYADSKAQTRICVMVSRHARGSVF